MHLFYKARHSLLVLRDSTLALCLGVILNRKISNKKHKNGENMALNRLWKGYCLQEEGWDKKEEHLFVYPGNVCIWQLEFLTSLRMSAVDRENAMSWFRCYILARRWIRHHRVCKYWQTLCLHLHPMYCTPSLSFRIHENPEYAYFIPHVTYLLPICIYWCKK